ncbi:3'(2'),5'-bisphosphate nucleotidase CysQ [Stappia albiluteola]|uniref:3'(2'),5'-bisphosphate nucleotidase CysQ n=1 Tax=Stappia albiluteola TaxID=2758565 RepID=UPI001F1C8330|nr:3'(2'),5'-bisphosphate nucleotidase CysQ [Stappia albiluteola]
MTDLNTIRILNAIAWAAGRVTLSHYRNGTSVQSKADDSPVTLADQQAEDLILAQLKQFFPDVPVVAEEAVSAGNVPPSAGRFFLVDPLDGTREFISGRPDYTVNIALIENGVPVAGVVLAPARGEAFAGSLAAGAYRLEADNAEMNAETRIQVRRAPTEALVAVASRSHNSPETEAFLDRLGVTDRVSVGSSLKFCLLACGEADVYPRFGRTMEWDTAAGQAVLAAAGGAVIRTDGTPLAYDKRGQATDTDFANPDFIAFGDQALESRVRQAIGETAAAPA